jgi:hypothetical protein
MTNQVHSLRASRVDKRSDVLRELVNAIVPATLRPSTRRIPALKRGQATVSLRSQPRDDRVPHRVLLGEAMQQNNHRPVSRSGVNDVEHELAAAELIHRPTVSRGCAARPPITRRYADR